MSGLKKRVADTDARLRLQRDISDRANDAGRSHLTPDQIVAQTLREFESRIKHEGAIKNTRNA